MTYIFLGILGFVILHIFDVAALKRLPWLKPITWLAGSSLFIYAVSMACLAQPRLALPLWAVTLGWLALPGSIALLLYSLFINLPLVRTYLRRGVGDKLITTGLYAVVRHPGVCGFALSALALTLVSGSRLMLVAAPLWTAIDIILVIAQDKVFFGRMFPGYAAYRRQTPMLVPSWQSLAALATDFSLSNLTLRRSYNMSKLAELFVQGRYDEVWQRCCGFIDLSLEDFMRIQKRLLLEQMELFRRCELGQRLMAGAVPETVEQFREMVPLTTYADYAPYLLKRRMDVLPRKPLLWQYTSGKSGEYAYRWAPVTARMIDEIEPVMFGLMFLSAASKRGDVNLQRGDKVLYGMAPPPYATGTMVRAFPNELFSVLPPVEEAEQMPFEERIKKGFDLALGQGLDMCVAMSSVAVAIGQRLSAHGRSKTDLKAWLSQDPAVVARLGLGALRAKLGRRSLMPKDLWRLKGLITFGIDGAVFREKIKAMWGRYPLDFHGCTEAPIIATQTWDYQGMTFVPHLNFFEFIPEKDALRSRLDEDFQPRTLLMDELEPGNYELVITSFHGGPFMRYRLGHLVKILSRRNERLGIDIPQMSFIARIDDQIDIAGFTRLGEKAIWQAVENTGLGYEDWVARKEVKNKPILHLFVELSGASRYTPPEKVASLVHKELKKLDKPYAELEAFTGIHPLKVTLLPEGAFRTFKLRQQAAGARLGQLRPQHINPSEEVVDFLVSTAAVVRARAEVEAEVGA